MRNEILEYFRKANGQFVSGEQISKDLNVSRTAIWKHIKILKSRGYIFESSTRKGWKLKVSFIRKTLDAILYIWKAQPPLMK